MSTTNYPIKDMKIDINDDTVKIQYKGTGNGLLIHQSHLADQIINSVLQQRSRPV